MKPLSRHRALLSAAGLVVLVIAVGIVNFFIGGTGNPSGPGTMLSPEKLLPLVAPPKTLVHLGWGDGSGASTNDSLEYVFASGGYVFVMDHTGPGLTPRVRWFDTGGELRGETSVPTGTTGFGPHPVGFSYIQSPGIDGSAETAGVFSVAESRLTTYTVPLGLHAAKAVTMGQTLYVQVDDSTYDSQTLEVSVVARLVPVARDGVQLSDNEASAGVIDGFDVGLDGRVYTRQMSGKAVEDARPQVTYADTENNAELTVSQWSQYAGADTNGHVFFLFKAEDLPGSQDLVGTTTAREQYGLVLVGSMRGGGQWLLPVRLPRALQIGRSLLSVSPDGLLVTRAGASGVDVLLYKGDFE